MVVVVVELFSVLPCEYHNSSPYNFYRRAMFYLSQAICTYPYQLAWMVYRCKCICLTRTAPQSAPALKALFTIAKHTASLADKGVDTRGADRT